MIIVLTRVIHWITFVLLEGNLKTAITVGETGEFIRTAKKIMDDLERASIVDFLSRNPEAGEIIEGTGGVRKLRWALPGKGKSGGARVIYYYHSQKIPLYILTVYPNGRKDNLTQAEKNILKKLVVHLKRVSDL
jgi:hypothetical protein